MSMTTGMKNVSVRWRKASRALKIDDQKYGIRLAEALETHKGPEYAMFDDPLEASVFFLLIEMMKEKEKGQMALATGKSH
ncbi:MAG: hypothetical protein WCJ93_08750 [Methanomicrobiales archaeon]